ncbi:MAG TPA: 16S rRNA (adenine(1518)-N(6)/adenine(1519)-N(6))-dimethyltransferase RsmA [Burkholderiaceae bacterium]|nr:16S rRNA (adenine(1518)-N(6)/adenine(1519)-N(6))-dimethyltransferase RsmA [Burkholderiaceae bacterium]
MQTPRHRARRRFGQNFLHDPRVVARIVDAIDPHPGETIVEIGPGQAALTRRLIEHAGHVTALEIDRDLAAWLRHEFPVEQLTLIVGDALDFGWSTLRGPLRIVGNLPYNISSPLLFALLPIADRVVDQHFMLQKEVVERMVAGPGNRTYGRLSAMLQSRYRMSRLFDVPRGAFRPAPEVTSSIVRMQPLRVDERPDVDPDGYAKVVAAAFNQRRKTLRNALAGLLTADQIAAAGVDPQARAETLSVRDFAHLTAALGAAAAATGATV